MNEKQLDRLKKLVALANNNPNDNEANLAARNVCKMLAEHKFNLSPTLERTTTPDFKSTRPQNPPPPYRPTKAQEDFYNDKRQRRPYSNPFDYEDMFNNPYDWFRKRYYGDKPPNTGPPPPQDRPYSDWVYHVEKDEYVNKKTGQRQSAYEFKNRSTWRDRDPNYGYTTAPKKCSKCGEEVDTTWIGPLDKFVCVNCKWKGMP